MTHGLETAVVAFVSFLVLALIHILTGKDIDLVKEIVHKISRNPVRSSLAGTFDDRAEFEDGRPEFMLDIPDWVGQPWIVLATVVQDGEKIPESFHFVPEPVAQNASWKGKLFCRNDLTLECGKLNAVKTINNRLLVTGKIHGYRVERTLAKR